MLLALDSPVGPCNAWKLLAFITLFVCLCVSY